MPGHWGGRVRGPDVGVADPGTLWLLLQRAPWGPPRVAVGVGWEAVFRRYKMDTSCSPALLGPRLPLPPVLPPGCELGGRACGSYASSWPRGRRRSECGTGAGGGSPGKAAREPVLRLPQLHPFHPFSGMLFPTAARGSWGTQFLGGNTLGVFFDPVSTSSLFVAASVLSFLLTGKKVFTCTEMTHTCFCPNPKAGGGVQLFISD